MYDSCIQTFYRQRTLSNINEERSVQGQINQIIQCIQALNDRLCERNTINKVLVYTFVC